MKLDGKSNVTRRGFLAATPAAGLALQGATTAPPDKPALLGGRKVRSAPFPSWPKQDQREEQLVLQALRSGQWYRGNGQLVKKFEQAYAELTGARHCLATANGTSALVASLNAVGIEPGDEVIVPPYTYIATINAVLRQYALPVFTDTDRETFQMDAHKVEAAITDRTRAIIPVHLGGNVCDIDAFTEITRRRKVILIEDACQAHLAEWKGRKVGTFGDTGCFSFQASKNLNSGEGGAVLFSDSSTYERAYAFHNNGNALKPTGAGFEYASTGMNLRLPEFQAALLLAQMTRIEDQARTRTTNAKYLSSMLSEIPGNAPAHMHDGCTRNAYHLYMWRYDSAAFSGLSRDAFLKALRAEGIPASGGYAPLNTQAFLSTAVESRGFKRIFPESRLRQWRESNHCPVNDKLCSEAIWLTQTMLLGSRTDMEQIAEAVRKIQTHSGLLARA